MNHPDSPGAAPPAGPLPDGGPDAAPDAVSDTSPDPAPDPVIDAFDDVCRRLAGFEPALDTEYADGFLSAVAASWRVIELDEVLAPLCGDAFERAFGDPEDVARARGALQARLQALRAELDPAALFDDPDRLRLAPLMQVWDDAARADIVAQGLASQEEAAQLHTGHAWAAGFFAALQAFAEDWPEPGPKEPDAAWHEALLRTVAALTWDPAGEEFRAFAAEGWKDADPSRDEVVDEACFAVQDLRVWWLDHAPRLEPRRVAAAPGRNDPCWCGSGRKFKKCHGAAA